MSELLPFIAILAGIISFFASCFVPLIPLYVSYLVGTNLAGDHKNIKNLHISIFFALGFLISFLSFSIFALTFIKLLIPTDISRIIIGMLLIILGIIISLQDKINIPFLNSGTGTNQLSYINATKFKSVNSLLFGFFLGLSWSPCVSPLLGGFSTLAATASTATYGIFLLVMYGLGLTLPFILIGFVYDKFNTKLTTITKHINNIKIIIGIIMILVGINYIYNIVNLQLDHFTLLEVDISSYLADKYLFSYK